MLRLPIGYSLQMILERSKREKIPLKNIKSDMGNY
jgi:hypothetical protein